MQEADVARQVLKLGAELLQAVRDHNGAFRLASSDSIELCLDVRADRRQHKLRVDSSNRLGAISMQLRVEAISMQLRGNHIRRIAWGRVPARGR